MFRLLVQLFTYLAPMFLYYWGSNTCSGQTSTVLPSDFINLNVNNKIYCLTKSKKSNVKDAKVQCQQIGAELAFFNTNAEYLNVYTALHSFPRETWITFNATVVKYSYMFWWRNEAFNNLVWAGGEPNENCFYVNKICCARIRIYSSMTDGLADKDCSSSYYFLCKAIPKCPFGAARCYSNCGEPLTQLECLKGFKFNATRVSCDDVNECEQNKSLCIQNCVNTIGSYYCNCSAGYKVGNDNYSCVDIDECSLVSYSPCEQDCINNVGSFRCACRTGYKLTNNSRTCEDINECNNVTQPCQQTCNNTIGSFVCSCRDGYLLAINRHNCTTVNQCLSSPCQHMCLNTTLSYSCGCYSGYTLNGDLIHCSDIDECTLDKCSHNCTNTDGTYYCSCPYGYIMNSYNTCTDVDECINGEANCTHGCTNTDGSYFCECKPGYVGHGNNCSDIDECMSGASNCSQQHCNNSVGSYICWCDDGYRVADDQVTCLDIDECEEKTSNCPQLCENINGRYICKCDIGYTLSNDNVTCNDIDECMNATCHEKCINSDGSFYCSCNNGYYPDPSNLTFCLDIDECAQIQTLCVQLCSDVDNSSQSACSDIKDCQLCNQNCTNTDGSYSCSCKTGYDLDPADNMTCLDIDECSFRPRVCEGDCNNVPGSYHCSCQPGFFLSENRHSCQKSINQCPCSCSYAKRQKVMGQEQLKEILMSLQKSLQVTEQNLASHRLLLTSQDDDRIVTKFIGYVGVVIVAVAFSAIVIQDGIIITRILVDMIKARLNRMPQI